MKAFWLLCSRSVSSLHKLHTNVDIFSMVQSSHRGKAEFGDETSKQTSQRKHTHPSTGDSWEMEGYTSAPEMETPDAEEHSVSCITALGLQTLLLRTFVILSGFHNSTVGRVCSLHLLRRTQGSGLPCT